MENKHESHINENQWHGGENGSESVAGIGGAAASRRKRQ